MSHWTLVEFLKQAGCHNLTSAGSSYISIVWSFDIVSAKMLSLPLIWMNLILYSCSSIAYLSSFTIFMPLDRKGPRGLWSHLKGALHTPQVVVISLDTLEHSIDFFFSGTPTFVLGCEGS